MLLEIAPRGSCGSDLDFEGDVLGLRRELERVARGVAGAGASMACDCREFDVWSGVPLYSPAMLSQTSTGRLSRARGVEAGREGRGQEVAVTVQRSTCSYRAHRHFEVPLAVPLTEVERVEEGESAVIESFKGMGSRLVNGSGGEKS